MQQIGKLWWSADSQAELDQELTGRLSHPDVKVLKVEQEEDRPIIHYVFSLPVEKAEEILGYVPDEEEWLIEEDDKRNCYTCKHFMAWEEYGQDLIDCREGHFPEDEEPDVAFGERCDFYDQNGGPRSE